MILYLMRHGQTSKNAEGRIQGLGETALTKCGLEQARIASEKLKNENIETIYASDLKQCRKTADIISGTLDLPVHYTKRLREMNFGHAEGIKITDLEAKFPYIYQAFNDLKNPERYDVCFPNGETIGDVQQRFMKFVSRLWIDGRSKVLIVTHGTLIRVFAENCFKKTISLENGSVLRVAYDERSKKFKSPKVLF